MKANQHKNTKTTNVEIADRTPTTMPPITHRETTECAKVGLPVHTNIHAGYDESADTNWD